MGKLYILPFTFLFNCTFQIEALHRRIAEILDVAASCGVAIACMQEAWSMLLSD